MISNPELPALSPSKLPQWPRMFTHWQLLSLVPGAVPRLEKRGRALELEVGGPSLLGGLARSFPSSQFIGLTSFDRARRGLGVAESSAGNLHFRTVESFDLSPFRQVDLLLALGGVRDRTMLREMARTMAAGGELVLREQDTPSVTGVEAFSFGTRFLPTMDESWAAPPVQRQALTTRTLLDLFPAVHVVCLPEDPGYLYYVARAT